ncbi:MAG: c-type cytochrome [Sphingomonas sp.]
MKDKRVIGALISAFVLLLGALLVRHQSVEAKTLMMRTGPDAIMRIPDLRDIAIAHGQEVFRDHCASCHGTGGKGSTAIAVPDLTDADFLYGQGSVSEIEQIVLHGIRAGDTRGWNLALMPAFAQKIPYAREPLNPLTPAQTDDIIAFLRAANGNGGYDRAQIDRGRQQVTDKAGCWDCHGRDAQGDTAIGAPNLVDGKWIKGDGGEADIRHTLERGMAGVSPAFARKLSAYDTRTVAIYAASLHPPVK